MGDRQDRETRLAAQLRENLKRRKVAAREGGSLPDTGDKATEGDNR